MQKYLVSNTFLLALLLFVAPPSEANHITNPLTYQTRSHYWTCDAQNNQAGGDDNDQAGGGGNMIAGEPVFGTAVADRYGNGWGFGGGEIACVRPNAAHDMGHAFSLVMWAHISFMDATTIGTLFCMQAVRVIVCNH